MGLGTIFAYSVALGAAATIVTGGALVVDYIQGGHILHQSSPSPRDKNDRKLYIEIRDCRSHGNDNASSIDCRPIKLSLDNIAEAQISDFRRLATPERANNNPQKTPDRSIEP